MSSFCYGRRSKLIPEVKEKEASENGFEFDEFSCSAPEVFCDCCGESYYPQISFSCFCDSLISIRNGIATKYSKSDFTELLAEDENGNIIWVDGRTAPYSGCWGGKYLDEERDATEYEIIEYDSNTSQKKKYKIILEETSPIDSDDYEEMKYFIEFDQTKIVQKPKVILQPDELCKFPVPPSEIEANDSNTENY